LLIALPALRLTALSFLLDHDLPKRKMRQYDALEPENRLVARSLERVWQGPASTQPASNRATAKEHD